MNILRGKIASIKTSQSLSLVTIKIQDVFFKTIVIETPDTATYLKSEEPINLIFKETEVIIGKGSEHQISIQNKVMGTIRTIEKGELLCKLSIVTKIGEIIAILICETVTHLQLKVDEKITVMIKPTEIMLSQ